MNTSYSNILTSSVSYAAGAISKTGLQKHLYGLETGSYAISPSADFTNTKEPVWILGEKYSVLHQYEELISDLKSRIWMTYRRGFAPIDGTGPTSDQGWGCMLRCGQMVLAQALIMKYLGRSWRWVPPINDEDGGVQNKNEPEYFRTLSLFLDKKISMYSIHQISLMGASEGKPVGQWFGPNTIAQALKKLCTFDRENNIVIHVAMDNIVVMEEIRSICRVGKTEKDDSTINWKPLLLFIPLRLGLNEVNPIYFKSLMRTFKLSQSLGIIGGRPNHALYFIGCFENQLIYLDPHTTQPAIDLETELVLQDTSYHQECVCRMEIQQIDPSLALCFYCHTEADFDSWCSLAMKYLILNEKQPLFEITKQKTKQWSPNKHDCDSEHRYYCDYDVVSNVLLNTGAGASATASAMSDETVKESFSIIDEKTNLSDSDEEFELLG